MRKLRSREWFTGPEYYNFARRAWLRSEGFGHEIFEGEQPIVGICNTWSELNNCNMGLRELAEHVRRGVLKAGGVPLEFPVISLGEMLMKPTAMMFRNLMSMDVEECIRAHPLDSVVLLGGCDKTVPALLMGAASADVPAIVVTTGPMLAGLWEGQCLGSGTDGRKLFDRFRTGDLSAGQLEEIEGCIARSTGHCTVMGTASTMACMAEALGMTLPGCAAIPAPDARRKQLAELSGSRAVELALHSLSPSQVMTRAAFENAVTVLMALGGSTNAVVHLLAIAGRLGVELTIDDFDRISRRTPTLVNLKPSGEHLMEHFFAAGGVPALLGAIEDLLHLDAVTVSAQPIRNQVRPPVGGGAAADAIRSRDRALFAEGGIAVLRGNLSPDGALIKQSAASPELMCHRGPAYVFENYEQLKASLNRTDLPFERHTVFVLQNAGPKGGPGFPEWGSIPMPKVLLDRGVRDVVRVSDSRMSGTSFGTVVLHVAPESAAGGPLAFVQTGDEIELDVAGRRLRLCVSDVELERRARSWQAPPPRYRRGYGKLFLDHVLQAGEGCDFDFLRRVTPSPEQSDGVV
jgi:dihydroxy-acid dehydratase